MTIKLIASDMDGTFLNDKGTYNRQKFETILKQLDERDIKFVVASGNNMDRLNLIFKGLTDRLDFVAENGAHVIFKGENLNRHKINAKDVTLFLDYYKDFLDRYAVMVSSKDKSYMQKNAKLPTAMAIDPEEFHQFFLKIKQVDDFSEIDKHQVLKITMMLPEEICDAVIADFNDNFPGDLTAVTSGFGAVDVIQTGIHKAWGLQLLMDKYDISSDEIMAFGDGGNDIEMLKLAKYSYAMENAPQSVKDAAKFIAPHHHEEGVLQILETFLVQVSAEEDSDFNT